MGPSVFLKTPESLLSPVAALAGPGCVAPSTDCLSLLILTAIHTALLGK